MHIAERMYKRVMLRKMPNSKKKVVFMLNIGPCSTVEATLGLAHGLDSMESTVRMLRRLKEDSYDVIVPESGDALRDLIIQRHAYPEFRWTSVNDTVQSGGVFFRFDVKDYTRMFNSLDPKVKEEVIKVWGEPPGEGMLHENSIILPGIELGNAVVMIQPKRGCVGRECSGKYCKILTDPYCPPNHHYIATYLFLDRIWKADAYIGMGSHGTLEHLPGKRNGLSTACYPDLCLGTMPNLYTFDACDSVHATIAKRRAYATMLGHMPSVSKKMNLSKEMIELQDLIGSFRPTDTDVAYIESFKESLWAALDSTDLILDLDRDAPLEKNVGIIRKHLDSIMMSFVEMDKHIYGDIPGAETVTDMVAEYETYNHPDLTHEDITSIAGTSIVGQSIDDIVRAHPDLESSEVSSIAAGAADLYVRVQASDEMGSFINTIDGGFTEPGPAGNLLRGKSDIYPTGRNLFGANPALLPTRVSYKIGCDLADTLIEKYVEDNGAYPEEIAISWMSNDLTIADGELIGQVMALIGVEPIWSSESKLSDFRIIPKEELKRPRVDVLIRSVGTILAVYKDRVDLLDRMITAVAVLDEPADINPIHAHMMASVDAGATEQEASSRIFGAGPGLSSGLYYAVMASAWETDADLAGIFLTNNGYAYGAGKDGVPMHGQFGYQLSRVSATFNKIASDDKDLMLSGAFFTSQGGMAMASEHITGKKVKSYYGDTRYSKKTAVRTLSDEINRLTSVKVLNPDWIDANMKGGYDGAQAMMSAVQKLYGWKITSKDVDDRVFDGIVREYVENPKVREFLQKSNPFALEDLERRMLELETRGLWKTDEETLKALKDDYLLIEGDLEEFTDDPDCQRGEIKIDRMTDEYAIGRDIESTNRIVAERMSKH